MVHGSGSHKLGRCLSSKRGTTLIAGKCLPQRELKRLYTRARKILAPGTHLGKWTSEEIQALME